MSGMGISVTRAAPVAGVFGTHAAGASGGVPTYFVAASDATDHSKGLADYVCTGTEDEATINEAIAALPAYVEPHDPDFYYHRLYGGSGRIALSEGTFNLSGPIVLTAMTSLIGLGSSTLLRAHRESGSIAFNMIEVVPADSGFNRADCIISDLLIDGADGQEADDFMVGIEADSDHIVIERIHFYRCSRGINFTGGDYRLVSNCVFEECALNVPGRQDDQLQAAIDGDISFDEIRACIGGTPVYDVIGDCKFLYADYDCIFADGGVFFTVSNCEMSDSSFYQHSACFTAYNCGGFTLTGCHSNNGSQFIQVVAGHHYQVSQTVAITGNSCSAGGDWLDYPTVLLWNPWNESNKPLDAIVMSGNSFDGLIVLDGEVKNNLIANNIVFGGGKNRTVHSGHAAGPGDDGESYIILTNGASHNTIQGNKFMPYNWTTPDWAIHVATSDCVCNWITGNDCADSYDGSEAIHDNGVNTDITFNRTACGTVGDAGGGGGGGPTVTEPAIKAVSSADGDSVQLYWGDDGHTVYEIEFSQDGGTTWTNVGVTVSGFCWDIGLGAALTGTGHYLFRVFGNDGTPGPPGDPGAFDLDCSSACSIADADEPTLFLAQAGIFPGDVDISWFAPGSGAPDHYRIKQSTDNGVTWSSESNVFGTSVSYASMPSGTYFFLLTPVDASNVATGDPAISNALTI